MTLDHPSSTRSGLTFLEILCAATVGTIGLLGYSATVISSNSLSTSTTEANRALAASHTAFETLELLDDGERIVRFDGYNFEVPGLGGPDPKRAWSDGTYSELVPSYTFPLVEEIDPLTGELLFGESIPELSATLFPASKQSVGYGRISVDSTRPELLEVTVTIEYGGHGGNKRLVTHGHIINQTLIDELQAD